jgi:phospholipase/lecithinase/hemolysin
MRYFMLKGIIAVYHRQSVRYVPNGNYEFEIYVQLGNYESTSHTVVTGGSWTENVVNTGSTSAPNNSIGIPSQRSTWLGPNEVMTQTQAMTSFNETSHDHDFRVESNSNAHAIFVDGNNNSVAVGTSNTEGATTNFMPLVAGRFATKWGTATNLAVNTWITIYTFEANSGNFIVSARGSGTGNVEDNTTGIAHIQAGPSSKYTDLLLGNRCDLRMSGANLQVNQSIFTGANISWSVMRICN